MSSTPCRVNRRAILFLKRTKGLKNRNSEICLAVLAAGKGTRMGSDLPKVLHPFKGRPMIDWVLDAGFGLAVKEAVVVTGYGAEYVESHLKNQRRPQSIQFVRQIEQKGTADALACLYPFFSNRLNVSKPSYINCKALHVEDLSSQYILILLGDTPKLRQESLAEFCDWFFDSGRLDLSVLATEVDNPKGYGRVFENTVAQTIEIIEEKDGSTEQLKNKKVNTGIFLAKTKVLFSLLSKVQSSNKAGEFYATDIFSLAKQDRYSAGCYVARDAGTFVGVNTPEQLRALEVM